MAGSGTVESSRGSRVRQLFLPEVVEVAGLGHMLHFRWIGPID